MKDHLGWMERIAEGIEIEESHLPGLPLVEIWGDRRVLIENHRGVSRYAADQICVRVSYGEVSVRGCNLELARMNGRQLVICGRIDCVTLCRRGKS